MTDLTPDHTNSGPGSPTDQHAMDNDRPMVARTYGYTLGGKDNYSIDRATTLQALEAFPELLDIARQNRLFLYRVVRYLAREAGIRQYLDLGSGYPTERNVHQVAQEFHADARVVYVDIDPLVLVHGRALLADTPNTTVVTADMTRPEQILENPEVTDLIDFDEPVAVLLFSIPHCIPDDAAAQRAIHAPLRRAAPGSYLALSHVVADDTAAADDSTRVISESGLPWRTRTPATVDAWLSNLTPVDPGMQDITQWRPDPDQPPLSEIPQELTPYLGAAARLKRVYEYGGVLLKE